MEAKTKKTIILAIVLPTFIFAGYMVWDKGIQPYLAKRKAKKDEAKNITPNSTPAEAKSITSGGITPKATQTT